MKENLSCFIIIITGWSLSDSVYSGILLPFVPRLAMNRVRFANRSQHWSNGKADSHLISKAIVSPERLLFWYTDVAYRSWHINQYFVYLLIRFCQRRPAIWLTRNFTPNRWCAKSRVGHRQRQKGRKSDKSSSDTFTPISPVVQRTTYITHHTPSSCRQ